ncbi:MAG: single-stranded DNA binding protein [Halovenus sp.]
MGAIEEIYEDLDADVAESEFREAVARKVEQMEGLADEETAAMILAHELADNEVDTVADIDPAMDEVKFIAKVRSVGDVRTFERDDGEDGRVVNVEAADETGTVRLAFWDEQATAIADGGLEPGDVLRVKGRPKEGYNGLEVSVDKAEPEEDVDVDVDLNGEGTIDGLALGQSDVTVTGLVLDTDDVRTFDRDDGSEGRVANLTIGDETGRIRVTLWDAKADRATEIEPGETVEVVDGYVREREGDLELHVGDRGSVDVVDVDVEFDPETRPIGDLEIGQTADIAGVVRSTDPKRTFDRDDGSEGQVRNVRLQDDTGDIRVALWGDKADIDLAPGDEVLAANVETEDGWQDDIEASANWQSAVVVLADGSDGGTETAAGDSHGSQTGSTESQSEHGNLAAFATDSREGDQSDGEEVSFTGTVIQTGEPVILDNGEETMPVETDTHVDLGKEVTVRGEFVDGHLDADEVL